MNEQNENKGWPLFVKYQAQFAALQQREKYSVLFVGLFLIVYLGLWFVVFPQQDAVNSLRVEQNTLWQKLNQNEAQLSMLTQALKHDYTKVLRNQVGQTQRELEDINNKLSTFSQGFISANKVPAVLKDLLVNTPDVQVVGFRVNPAKAIDVEKLGEHDTQTLFFEHQMVVTLQGRYFSLQQYLEGLKASQQKLLIQQFNYQVQTYPNAELTLQIATVSANEKFIAL
ncbi:agglutinin biogenesis protein MshJ [Pseudoalteromonas sp. UBA2102]|uniref:agglutinin biogenesis protein MshJ n=1 Tax=Pseudoalteromonas sp. UBA2102 TaxID=1947291 RepID=UPI00257FA889|nr:agglutinin biogenesis protein MshJ [Pseudoalteromonas sp. UBA2102]|tara:strand:+ start:2695 stop:3375 length:681 start_codon:yes stop_codon:yes gene_type:complete